MSGFGTDVVALACILCGGAVGGAATLTLMDVQDEVGFGCAVATVEEAPRVVVSLGGEDGAIVVRPRVRVHTFHDCASVRVHEAEALLYERLEIEMEEEMQRVQVQLERLEIDQLEEIERDMEREMGRLQKRLEKTGGEI